jgi:hypothetical protein
MSVIPKINNPKHAEMKTLDLLYIFVSLCNIEYIGLLQGF